MAANDLGLEGKTALITGASSGIGKATAIRLAEAGADVAIVARRADLLACVAEEIRARNARALAIAADVTRAEDAQRLIEQTVETFGGIDVLVNAAGIMPSGTIETTTLEAWDEILNLNLRAVFNLIRLALPSLIERKGNVVNVSSVAGLRATPGLLAYSVSKAGLDQLTRGAALELAPKGVRVNAVNPGLVLTNLHRAAGMDDRAYADLLERSKSTHPLGRVGRPEEVAELIAYLASPRAAWITGVTYPIDGGRSLTVLR